MKDFVFALLLGGMLSILCQGACASPPKDSASKAAISVETSQEDTLLSYHISDEHTAYLFSIRSIETHRQNGKKTSTLYNHLYVDVEHTATGERRRIWQLKSPISNPQKMFRSFAFGPADTEGQLCLGMASAYRVRYLLLDLDSDTEEGKRLPPILSGSLHIPKLMVYKILDVAGLSPSKTTIQHISYSSTDGWKLGIHVEVPNFESMLPIELQGTPKGEKVQWHLKKLF